MAYTLKTAPAAEPVLAAEAKAHLRVDISDDDTLIGNLIKAAREYVERRCRPRRALINQTWQYVADEWPSGDTLELEVVPLSSVTSITYIDEDGVSATFAAANYLVDTYSTMGRIRLKTGITWPAVTLRELNGLTCEFVAGYGAASTAIPYELRQAILLLVGHWYENREASLVGVVSKEIDFAVNALLTPFRMRVG